MNIYLVEVSFTHNWGQVSITEYLIKTKEESEVHEILGKKSMLYENVTYKILKVFSEIDKNTVWSKK